MIDNALKMKKIISRLKSRFFFLESLKEYFSNRARILILLAAALLSISYLTLSTVSSFNDPILRTKRLANKDGRFSFLMGSLISTAEVKQSNIYLLFDQKIEKLEILLTDRTYPTIINTHYQVIPLSSQRFKVAARPNLQDWLVECTPQRQLKTLEVRVVIRPVFRVDTLLFQFFILFFVILLIMLTALFSYNVLTHRVSDLEDLLRPSLAIFLLMGLTIYLYFFLKLPVYIELWNLLKIPFPKILLFNFLAAAFFGVLFFIHMKKRMKLVLWPVLMSILYFSFFPRYELKFCGDATQWVYLAAYKGKILYFAEFLSFSWAKALNKLFNHTVSISTSALIFSIDAKVIGVLFSFVLYALVKSQKDLSAANKAVLFISTSVLTMNALFLGHPEFAFYQVPFLLISVLFSMKYVSSQAGRKYLYLAAFFLTLAGLFHGSGYFSAPVLFLLPFLKEGQGRLDKKRILTLLKDYGIILLIALALILSVYKLGAFLGYFISFQNVKGGGDNDMFADLFPSGDATSWGEKFLEMRYLWERGLGVFLAFPILFFLLINRIQKWKGISSSDFILFLFGITQISVFFLWSYDLGFRDFDLIISPWTILNFLFMKIFLNTFNHEGKLSKSVLFVSLFAVTSNAFLLLFWTAHFPPLKF